MSGGYPPPRYAARVMRKRRGATRRQVKRPVTPAPGVGPLASTVGPFGRPRRSEPAILVGQRS
jgi:hypothetical protein